MILLFAVLIVAGVFSTKIASKSGVSHIIEGLILAALIILVARPIAVLATYPAAFGLENSLYYFNVVFFAIFLTRLVQGTSISWVAKKLGLSVPAKPKALYSVELLSRSKIDMDV